MENIIANNKLIAEFMGYNFIDGDFKVTHSNKTSNSDFKEWCPTYWDDDLDSGGYLVSPSNLLFHSDWNWLMEVVEKIESIKIETYKVRVDIYFNCCQIYPTHWDELISIYGNKETKLEIVYNACIEFIKWYSQQK